MTILPHCPSWGARTVKSRLLTGRTIPSVRALLRAEPLRSTEVALVTQDHSYYLWSAIAGTMGSPRRLASCRHTEGTAARPGRKLNQRGRPAVPFSYTEDPTEHLEEGARRARRQLGLTLTFTPRPAHHTPSKRSTPCATTAGADPHLHTPTRTPHRAKEHAVRDDSWG